MKNKKKYYVYETIQPLNYVLSILGLAAMVFVTILNFKNTFTENGYVIVMVFLTVWTVIAFLILYHTHLKKKLKFYKIKKEILQKGLFKSGRIIDVKKEVKVYINKVPVYQYNAQIEYSNGETTETFWTEPLVFDPSSLIDTLVKFAYYKKNYYIIDFTQYHSISKVKKSNPVSLPLPINNKSGAITYIAVGFLILLALFRFFYPFSNGILILLSPFIICVIGIIVKGILILFFEDKPETFYNIGDRIYLFGFALFWFGLLFTMAIGVIKNKNYEMLAFLSIFAVVGYIMIIRPFFKIK